MAYYEDDLFHPTNIAEDARSTDAFIPPLSRGRRLVTKKTAENDPNYLQIVVPVNVSNGGRIVEQKKKVAFYASTNLIRNAITGEYCDGYKVGSRFEELYFKVGVSNSVTNRPNAQSPVTLFYDSPEQWSAHMFSTISKSEVDYWRSKNEGMKNILRNSA